ncbi:MAG: GNAT family N-acetyltransferase [Chloroflexi bacterium]|nr:GNAT family N-acetyltransferase [Chloroflexota bacterium]
MTTPFARIRPMTAADTVRAAEMIRRGDWGERLIFFDWAVRHPTVAPLVAVLDDGSIVGTGVGSAHGAVGWVGTIFVASEQRRTGLGRALTRAVTDELEARGCRTLVLIATSMGRPVYERAGFTVLDEQVRFSIDGLPADGLSDPRLRPFAPGDLPAVVALDRAATGEDRSAVLADLVGPLSTIVVLDDAGEVRGFLTRAPWRGGALIAPHPDDALRLLEERRRHTGVSGKAGAGLVGRNLVGRARLRASGWLEEHGGVRMIRGEPLDWQPEAIWGQLNGALG